MNGKRIMTVDDSPSVRRLVSETLREAGCEVVEAVDGTDALSKLDPDLDLIIVDVNMPNMSGLTLLGHIRAHPDCRFAPVLMLTTDFAREKREEAIRAGASGWMVKPFRPEDLVAVVKRFLR